MSDNNGVSLSHLHEVPWSKVEGAYARVKIESTDHAAIGAAANPEEHTTTEEREGEIVGRGEGTGLWYDSQNHENVPTSIGPAIYLDTPQDTVLEVRTDKAGNELVEFTDE